MVALVKDPLQVPPPTHVRPEGLVVTVQVVVPSHQDQVGLAPNGLQEPVEPPKDDTRFVLVVEPIDLAQLRLDAVPEPALQLLDAGVLLEHRVLLQDADH